uniref:AsIV-cont00061-ORF1 n=1 Tax=Apophua simplicipes ichnovirus TaxID=1329648 RepID=S5DR76_9VIRU|nr:AsIV-cont00061-ORF1 [Apophua simplicipes ichnovirus]
MKLKTPRETVNRQLQFPNENNLGTVVKINYNKIADIKDRVDCQMSHSLPELHPEQTIGNTLLGRKMDLINAVKYRVIIKLDKVKFNTRTKLREDMTVKLVKTSWSELTKKLDGIYNSGYAAMEEDDDDEKHHDESVSVKSNLDLKLAALREEYGPKKQVIEKPLIEL